MSKLQTRLTRQLASRGVKGAKAVADKLLSQRGHLKGGKLTSAGKARQALGNAGRAQDRAVKAGGGKPSSYKYNAKTNKATKR